MLDRPDVDAGKACRTDVLYRKLVVEAEYFDLEALFFFKPYLWLSSSSISAPSSSALILDLLICNLFFSSLFQQLKLIHCRF